jgi:hypothetical protein
MKSISDLKRNVSIYEFKLVSNSWYKTVSSHQSAWRKVKSVLATKFSLLTEREDGIQESWINFPKRSEVEFKAIPCEGVHFELIITRKIEGSKPHVMVYWLRPDLESIN